MHKTTLKSMKKILAIVALVVSSSLVSFAQTFAYVDSELVLNELPAYQQAQQQIDDIVSNWNKEIQRKYQEIDEAYKGFQAESVLLSDNERRQREDEIVGMEREARKLQKQRFGPEGDLHKKRQDLVRPVQDEVYAAIEKVANRQKVDFILDKSGSVSILFANPKYDITNDVLKELGISGK